MIWMIRVASFLRFWAWFLDDFDAIWLAKVRIAVRFGGVFARQNYCHYFDFMPIFHVVLYSAAFRNLMQWMDMIHIGILQLTEIENLVVFLSLLVREIPFPSLSVAWTLVQVLLCVGSYTVWWNRVLVLPSNSYSSPCSGNLARILSKTVTLLVFIGNFSLGSVSIT